jgi:hypothetical protein
MKTTLNPTSVAAMMALLRSSTAHMVMNAPSPYDPSKVQTNPLDNIQYKFPCRTGNVDFKIGETTHFIAGENVFVNFTGQAVHGGGSCQFSVNYDDVPSSDPARWKVVYSILGGCMAEVVSTAGNLEEAVYVRASDRYGRPDAVHCGDDPNKTDCVRSFQIPLPKNLPSGRAHFSWTWFNKVGSREIYQNCASINIEGGASDDAGLTELPGLFVANIAGFGGSNCTTDHGVFNIPNPGKFGAIMGEMGSADSAQGTCAKVPIPDFPKGMGGISSAGGSAGITSAAASRSSAMPAPTDGPYSNKTAVATFATSIVAAGTGLAPVRPTGASSQKTIPCPKDGVLVCDGPDQWGLCNFGQVVVEPVAAGTKCVNGQILREDEGN